jgi:enoyl-CoA hydratase
MSTTDRGSVGVEIRDGVAWLTLDRPAKLNAITPEMTAMLAEAARAIEVDPSVRVAVITGAGDRAFSAGSDIGTLDEYPTPAAFRRRVDYCDVVRGITCPTIAMVNGLALGGGLEIALGADIRIASTRASFGAPEVKRGWIGGGGASQLLPRLVGYGWAARLLYSGETIDAAMAERIGLCEEVVSPEELVERTSSLARAIAANAPLAVRAAKRALRASMEMGMEPGMEVEEDEVEACLGSEDRYEGVAAFQERRAPDWRGR